MGSAPSRVGDADRFEVRSRDGTSLAVWAEGTGPPFVVVHGAVNTHAIDGPLVAELRDDLTVFTFDRRGRGESGDAASYSIEREFDDVAVVVEEVAAHSGAAVALWGHSYGADVAMGGATRTDKLDRLVLYEPGLGATYREGAIEVVEAAVAAGDTEKALLTVLAEIAGMTDEEIAFARSTPLWQVRLTTVPTVARELRAESGWVYRPGQFDAIDAPVLLLAGSESPPEQAQATLRAADAIPDARIRVLDGHGHVAHRADPAMVAAIVRAFVLG